MEHYNPHKKSDIYQRKILSHWNQRQNLRTTLWKVHNCIKAYLIHHRIHYQVSNEPLSIHNLMHKPMIQFIDLATHPSILLDNFVELIRLHRKALLLSFC